MVIPTLMLGLSLGTTPPVPPPEDVPEAILRTEIILDGRSPLDGQPLDPRAYDRLQHQLRQSTYPPRVSDDVQHVIFLLQLRKFVKTVVPRLP